MSAVTTSRGAIFKEASMTPTQPTATTTEVTEALPSELWALCYLHDWDPPKEGQEHRWEPGKNVFPEIHAFYRTWQEAEAIKRDMGAGASKYFVVRARPENEARLRRALSSPPGEGEPGMVLTTGCASEGCGKQATIRFERGGVGSYYCHDCYMRIQAIPASQRGTDK